MKKTSTIRNPRKGISLIEVAISSFLIGMLTIAALKTSGGVMQTWTQVKSNYDGSVLAESLLEEILQVSYEDPEGSAVWGIESGETQSPTNRSEFDDLDDYDDWTETPPKTKAGVALSGFTGWTRLVDIKKLKKNDPDDTHNDNSSDKGMRRVSVTVTDPNGKTTTVSGWRALLGTPETPKGVDGDFVTWVGCDLKIGATGETVSAGTNVQNHATIE